MSKEGCSSMPQGTVTHFQADTATATVLLDDETEVLVDAETFAQSHLEELRIGQRVRLELAEPGGQERARATRVALISL
jgi:cold shock CspA family protein